MKKIVLIVVFIINVIPIAVEAGRGCCSSHGGQSYCDTTTGKWVCNDGTYSPSCSCQQIYNYGCTNSNALNYDITANKDDGSCILKIYGCTDSTATNYDKSANVANGSCLYEKIEEYESDIKYKTVTIDGEENTILQNGENGKERIKKRITTDENNQIISTEILDIETLKEPIDEIIMVTKTENKKIVARNKKQNILSKFTLSIIIIFIIYLLYKKI